MIRHAFFAFLSLSLIGCVATTQSIGSNKHLTPEKKLVLYKEHQSDIGPDAWKKEVNATETFDDCFSALQCAIANREFDVAEFLLSSGADPNVGGVVRLYSKTTKRKEYYISYPIQDALLYAGSDDEANKWVKLLLEKGSGPDFATRNFKPALHLAIKKSYLETVQTLLGADAYTGTFSSKDPEGLDYELESAGPEKTYFDALTVAAVYLTDYSTLSNYIVSSLLEAGADPFYIRHSGGVSSFPAYALREGKPGLAEYSIEAYAKITKMTKTDLNDIRQSIEQEHQSYLENERKRAKAVAAAKRTQNEAQQKAAEVRAANEAYEAEIRRRLDSGENNESNHWAVPLISTFKEAEKQAANASTPIPVPVSPKPKSTKQNISTENQKRPVQKHDFLLDCNRDGIDDRDQGVKMNVCIE
ncbi:ankyrin repeat domain-containing protein [Vibrio sp. HN007]|uniref:ankyrin repeat domain-containing protein n=1 Tax=Vibrio iocasae TaxID=3098914 RepID=UPI0035D4FB7C